MKWGEYSNDVQFILQHSGSSQPTQSLNITSPISSPNNLQTLSPDRNKDVRKSLNFTLHHRSDNVGIVKGIPKQTSSSESKFETQNKNQERCFTSSPNSKVYFLLLVLRCEIEWVLYVFVLRRFRAKRSPVTTLSSNRPSVIVPAVRKLLLHIENHQILTPLTLEHYHRIEILRHRLRVQNLLLNLHRMI